MLDDETLQQWREDSVSAIRDGFGLEPEDVGDIADTRILALLDEVERLTERAEKAEAKIAQLREREAEHLREVAELCGTFEDRVSSVKGRALSRARAAEAQVAAVAALVDGHDDYAFLHAYELRAALDDPDAALERVSAEARRETLDVLSKLRAELIQVAAVAVQWVEAIDRRDVQQVRDGGGRDE